MSAVYFTAPDGTRYRVYDTAWKDGRTVAADPPVDWATNRVFVAEDGARRFYPLAYLTLHEDDSREPTPERLAWQFARSERGGSRQPSSLAARAASKQSDSGA